MSAVRQSKEVEPGRTVRPSTRASIIIVNYNGGHQLWRCLESLTIGLNVDDEILLVDNASADNSAQQAELLFPRLQVFPSATNVGFAAACNLGARHARGNYLVFLNPDTQVEPGWLDALLEPLILDPAIGLTTAKILVADAPEHVNACGNNVHVTGLTLCRGLGDVGERYREVEEVTAASGAAFAIRRELFEWLGGFDPAFFMYMEDTDLSLRARLAGWRIVLAPDSRVWHNYRLHFGPSKVFYLERNRYRMLAKVLRWPSLLALLPALLLAELITWVFVLWRGRVHAGNKLRAYAAMARSWPDVMQARQHTQLQRHLPDRALLRRLDFRLAFEQTGRGLVPLLADWVFNPAFWVLRALALALVWW